MTLSHSVFFFVAGIFGVLFGGLFLGLCLDRFFSGDLDVGDMATWAAAFGTLCTLGFLINQHMQLRKEQTQEKKEREAHEKKQQEMWDSQSQMFAFQNYQMHRKEFDNLLNSIEKKYEGVIHFFDRTGLYRDIFRSNTFTHTQYDLANDTHLTNSVLFTAFGLIESQSKLFANMKASRDYSQSKMIEDATHLLSDCLKVKFTGASKPGDVSNYSHKILNFIHPTEYFGRLVNINNELREFTNLPTVYLEHAASIERDVSAALAHHYLVEPAPEYIRVDSGPYGIAKLLANAWDILNIELNDKNSARLSHMRNDLFETFTSFRFATKQLDPNNPNSVRIYLRNLEGSLGYLSTEFPVQSPEWIKIRNLAMDIQHEIRLVEFEQLAINSQETQ